MAAFTISLTAGNTTTANPGWADATMRVNPSMSQRDHATETLNLNRNHGIHISVSKLLAKSI
jgi:hypothetical protein